MSTPDIIKDNIAPLVQRILADPLHFSSAKHQDIVTDKPASYIKIGQSSAKDQSNSDQQNLTSKIETGSIQQSSSGMAKARPASLAQAIAGYTGKRLADDTTTNKRGKKIRKLTKQSSEEQSENNEDLGEDLELVDDDESESETENAQDSEDQKEESSPSAVNSESNNSDGDEYQKSEQDQTEASTTPEATQESTPQQESESSSSDDDTNYTDAETGDFVSLTPHNIISKKVYEKYQKDNSSSTSGNDDEDDQEEDEDEEETPVPTASTSKIDVNNEDDEEEEEDDVDYVDKESESEAEESEEESTEDEGEDEESSEADELPTDDKEADQEPDIKRDLLAEKSENASRTGTNTPPTSPESDEDSDDSKSKDLSALQLSDFYGIEESPADRGSNDSDRIIKNWGSKYSTRKPLGLLNHGVTCYTNAAVQAMIHIPAVQHYLLDISNGKYKDTINPRSVSQTLAETSARMWNLEKNNPKKGGPKFINPKKLIGKLDDINCMMSEWQQEDSHEYFMSLLSRLQEDGTPKGKKLNENIIYDIFGGSLDQFVTCKSCGHVSKTQQEFYDLSLHLGASRKNSQSEMVNQQQSSLSAQAQTDSAEAKHRYSINKSIRDFFSPELIKTDRSDKSGYVCEKCKKRTNAIKISTIDRAPETLAVHLKRFRFNGSSSSKVKQGVSYPLILDLSQYTTNSEPVLYQLISVVVHEGRSVSSGHYIAHCRQPDGVWATYDDEYINTITEKQALKDPSAYYLIYTRLTHKDIKQVSAPIQKQSKVNTNKPSSSSSSNKSSVSSASSASTTSTSSPISNKIKQLRVGIAKPSKPTNLSPNNKKKGFNGLKPTNNLGNIGSSNQKRYAKDHGSGKSKRFKRY
ncbi:Ubiquitin carboxyl-terminal hydrolase [Wickerhamomyces ciferrii]|uniref:ubiquitinyl hydrolase 1 n=1 Tax=Wickerhamomyces ciferrii (strain ATCC 14091 / BCRC 22168 / CBS 111 / JCM 3599 / NBRC 0793 / NRRL Y-1031 F-60-10) TaxID=1206466 RepID=K0KHQ3_WICCF|nr:Ubiquitin carboxyl-terminal hydrolase [Wickerhamomyces ciferrii]CCH44735.1 Ubiquitin carboxyl-terminal hydrolase [Wickerhamomyces ciferrii]